MADTHDLLLFVFSAASSYRLQRYVVVRALKENRRVAILFTGGPGAFFSEVLEDAERLGIEAIALDVAVDSDQENTPWWIPFIPIRWKPIAATALLPLLSRPDQAWRFRQLYARRLRASLSLMHRLGAAAVVCSEDGISGDFALLAAARLIGIPIIDIPFGCGTIHELEVDLGRKVEEGRLIVASGKDLRLLSLIAPQWIKTGLFAGAVMYPPEMILALESLGMTLRDAWIIHGGFSDVLCVESSNSLRQYQREAIPEEKLRQTGSPYCDVMVNALSDDSAAVAALRQPHRIEAGVTRILVSWPPSYHDTYPGRNEFLSYAEMTRAMFSFLKELPNTQLTVSLHPACGDEMNPILDEVGIQASSDYLLELIPRHDIFVTYFSSTIRWALAAGKLVVNYDAYDIKLPTFDSAPGFINAATFTMFRERILSLLESEDIFFEISSRQVADASEWGTLDGKCTKRVFAEIDSLRRYPN